MLIRDPIRPSDNSIAFAAPARDNYPNINRGNQNLKNLDSTPGASLDFQQEREPFYSSERDTALETPI